MASDQRWNIVWQWGPEELKGNWHLLRVIGGVTLFMPPGSGRISLATEAVEASRNRYEHRYELPG